MATQNDTTQAPGPDSNPGIYFPLTGVMPLDPIPGFTGWASIPALLLIDGTAKLDDTARHHYRYQTDKKGLEETVNAGYQAQSALTDALRLIGTLTAHVDHKEVADEMASIGWLTCGLGELKAVIDSAVFRAGRALVSGDYLPDRPEPKPDRPE